MNDSLPELEWTWKNSIPYIVGVLLPSLFLYLQLIPAIQWTVIFILLLVGVGLTDLKNMEIAGNTIDFEDGKEETGD